VSGFVDFSATPLGDFGRLAFNFRPITHDLYDLSDIGAFAGLVAGVKRSSVVTVSGAVLGIRSAFRKYGAFIEVTEKTGMNRNRGLATQMVEKKVAQF
jgi:hypothetical protein